MSKEREKLIRYWEGVLEDTEHLLGPSVRYLIKQTIKDLQELDEIKEKEENKCTKSG